MRLLTNELATSYVPKTTGRLHAGAIIEGRVSRVAMGEPAAVPAGVYGRRLAGARRARGRGLQPRVVPFPTVRAVFDRGWEAGRVDAGVVYRTDAMTSLTCASSRTSRGRNIRISTLRIPPR